MKEKNDQTPETLWRQLEPDLEANHKARQEASKADLEQFGSDRSNIRCAFAEQLEMKTFEKVKEELGDKILLKLSEPSRFEVLHVKTIIKVSTEIKRASASQFQKEIDAEFPDLGAKYDVEKDIRETNAELEQKIEAKFKLETLFMSALDEKRFKEATIFLSAIEIARAKASVELQIELLNWKLNLAVKLVDIAMFSTALQKTIEMKDSIKFEDLKKSLESGLYEILSGTVFADTMVVPSGFGLSQAQKSGKTTQAYFEEQTATFAQSVVSEIISRVCTKPDSDLLTVVKSVLPEQRKIFLQINPCFKDIRGGPKSEKWLTKGGQ